MSTLKDNKILCIIKHGLCALSVWLIQMGAFAFFKEVCHLSYWLCYLTSLILSVVWYFLINKNYTFKYAENVPIAMVEVVVFYIIIAPILTLFEHFITNFGWNAYLVTAINMALLFAVKFVYLKFLVFGNQDQKKEFLRAVKYGLCATSAGAIQIGSFTLLNEVCHLSYWLGYLIALVLSVVWNFTLNRKFTFQSATNVPIAMIKVACYYAVFTPLSVLLEHWLTNAGWNEYLVTAINMIINFITEFLYQRFFVFGKSIDTAKKGEN